MPNWCENRMTVQGTQEELQRFQEKVKGKRAQYVLTEIEKIHLPKEEPEEQNLTFHSILPVPNDVLQAGFHEAGYEWQSKHWGTKWDVDSVRVTAEEGRLVYAFDTAWSPPEPFVKEASKQFPQLTFELAYAEPGIVFAGYVTYQNGEVIAGEHVSGDVELLKHILEEKFHYTEEETRHIFFVEFD